VNHSLQLPLEKGLGQSPGVLKTSMALRRSVPLQKSDVAIVKFRWGEGMRLCQNG
jgi:hypothetical protein